MRCKIYCLYTVYMFICLMLSNWDCFFQNYDSLHLSLLNLQKNVQKMCSILLEWEENAKSLLIMIIIKLNFVNKLSLTSMRIYKNLFVFSFTSFRMVGFPKQSKYRTTHLKRLTSNFILKNGNQVSSAKKVSTASYQWRYVYWKSIIELYICSML